jgi:hypothetical protein
VLGEQVGVGELGEQMAGLAMVASGEASRRQGGDVRARVQAQQPEHARGGWAEVADGPGEHSPHADRRVAHIERVQSAVGNTQLGRQRGESADEFSSPPSSVAYEADRNVYD